MAPGATESGGFSTTRRVLETIPLIPHAHPSRAGRQHRRSDSLGGGDREDGVTMSHGTALGHAGNEVLHDSVAETEDGAKGRAGKIFTVGIVVTIVLLLGLVGVVGVSTAGGGTGAGAGKLGAALGAPLRFTNPAGGGGGGGGGGMGAGAIAARARARRAGDAAGGGASASNGYDAAHAQQMRQQKAQQMKAQELLRQLRKQHEATDQAQLREDEQRMRRAEEQKERDEKEVKQREAERQRRVEQRKRERAAKKVVENTAASASPAAAKQVTRKPVAKTAVIAAATAAVKTAAPTTTHQQKHAMFVAHTSTTTELGRAAALKNRNNNHKPLRARLGRTSDAPGVSGVSFNGWLHLEEWFYSADSFFLVDAPEGTAQGTVFPPKFADPQSLGFQWASEGDLVSKMQAKHGDDATIEAFKAHRDAYMQQEDLDKLKALGYDHARLPVTWACFFGDENAEEKIVTDPAYPNVKQVTVSRASLNGYIAKLAAAGLNVLIDVHNMPGGSSLGTYNGVFPNTPKFWDDDNLKAVGRGILREMMHWYVGLAPDLKKAIGGFTLLNEPAHLMEDKKESMQEWYAQAINDYRDIVATPTAAAGAAVPKLFVNMIETSGMNVYQMAGYMKQHFTPPELADWAVLDLHMYLAWEHNGCDGGCAWRCDSDPASIRADVNALMIAKLSGLNSAAEGVGIAHTAVSEWSLATHHDSKTGCQSDAVIDAVYDAQSSALRDAGVTSYFWGWKMPNAGAHQKFWSMEYFQSNVHSPRMTLAPSSDAANGGNNIDAAAAASPGGGLDGADVRPLEAGGDSGAPTTTEPAAGVGEKEQAQAQEDGVLVPAEDIEAAANQANAIVEADAAQQQAVQEQQQQQQQQQGEGQQGDDGTWDGYQMMSVSPAEQGTMEGKVSKMLEAEQSSEAAAGTVEAGAQAAASNAASAAASSAAVAAQAEALAADIAAEAAQMPGSSRTAPAGPVSEKDAAEVVDEVAAAKPVSEPTTAEAAPTEEDAQPAADSNPMPRNAVVRDETTQ